MLVQINEITFKELGAIKKFLNPNICMFELKDIKMWLKNCDISLNIS